MAARGGRGGARGGRGARRGPGGLEAENKFKVSYDPKPAYPILKQPPPRLEADEWEVDCVAHMIDINRRRKLEPYYVPAFTGNACITKSRAATSTAKFDPFSGPATYSQKYHLPPRTAPDFKGKAWMKSFLPIELHFVVDSNVAKPSWMDEMDKKNPAVPTAKKSTKTATNLNLLDGNEEEDEEEDADKEVEPEEQDENWEEDEDEDMDYEKGEKDDYNAEQYFDNGEDDGDAFGGDADGGEF